MGYFIVINAFRHRALSEMRREIETWIIRDLEVLRPTPAAKLSDAALERFVGDYDLAAWRFGWTTREEVAEQAMRVTLANGVLYSQIGTHEQARAGAGQRATVPAPRRALGDLCLRRRCRRNCVLRGGRELEKAGYRASQVGLAGCRGCALTRSKTKMTGLTGFRRINRNLLQHARPGVAQP